MLAIVRSCVWLGLLSLTLDWTVVAAEGLAAAAAAETQAESMAEAGPAVPDDLAETVSAVRPDPAGELSAVLQNWQQACSKITRLDASFERYQYDLVFATESRGEGELAVDSQGRAAYRLDPSTIESGEVSHRKSDDGRPFQLKNADPARWHWTGDRVIQVDEKARTYAEIVLPNVTQVERPAYVLGVNAMPAFLLASKPAASFAELCARLETVVGCPLAHPFLLATPVEELQAQFEIRLVRQTEADIWLEFKSRIPRNAARFATADLLLKRADSTPKAIRTTDQTGNQVVHVLTQVRTNPRTRYFLFPIEPLDAPDLQGYRRLSVGDESREGRLHSVDRAPGRAPL